MGKIWKDDVLILSLCILDDWFMKFALWSGKLEHQLSVLVIMLLMSIVC